MKMLMLIGILGIAATANAQDLRLVPEGSDLTTSRSTARVWLGQKAPGHNGSLDRVTWISATGDLWVTVVGHPTRNGLNGVYSGPGECTTYADRFDLAGTVLTVMRSVEGPDILVFTKRAEDGRIVTVLRATIQVGVGCEASDL